MNSVGSSFQLRSQEMARNISYQDLSHHSLYTWLLMNISKSASEIPSQEAQERYERIPLDRRRVKQLFREMRQEEFILKESDLPLSLFTYFYTYLQSAMAAKIAENPESELLDLWQRAELALFYMSKTESEENALVVKQLIDALFLEQEKIHNFFHCLVEIAGRESNYMSCSLGFLIGIFEEKNKKETKVLPLTNGKLMQFSIPVVESISVDANIALQALHHSYKKMPERIEAFRRMMVEKINRLSGEPEAITRGRLQAWQEGIVALDRKVLPLIQASIAEFPLLILGEFKFQEEIYNIEKIYEVLRRYVEDCECVSAKIYKRFQSDTVLLTEDTVDTSSQPLFTHYANHLPQSIETIDELNTLIAKNLLPHPAYFSFSSVFLEVTEKKKALLHFGLTHVDLSCKQYLATTDTYQNIYFTENNSCVRQTHSHIFEYEISLEMLDRAIAFEKETQQVLYSFDTYISAGLLEVKQLYSALEKHRIDLRSPLIANPKKQIQRALAIKAQARSSESFEAFLRGFVPKGHLSTGEQSITGEDKTEINRSMEEQRAKLCEEELLAEVEQEMRISSKRRKAKNKKKNTAQGIPHEVKVAREEKSAKELFLIQLFHCQSSLQAAASEEIDSFRKTALLQARVALLRFEQVVNYSSLFSAKVWLPLFIEEGYLAIEQTLKGAFLQREEEKGLHGLKTPLRQNGLEELASHPIVEHLENGHIKSHRFLDVYEKEQRAKEWFSSYRLNPLIQQGVEALEEAARPLDFLIEEARGVVDIIGKVLVSRVETLVEERQEDTLEQRYALSLPTLSLASDPLLPVKPSIERRKDVEGCLRQASVFNQGTNELILHLNNLGNTFTEKEAAFYCKQIVFMATKSVELFLHALLISQNKQYLRFCHDLETLFEESFSNQNELSEVVKSLRNATENAHLCLRYPLQKARIYSSAHKVSLAASAVFGIPIDLFPRLFLESADEEIVNLPTRIQQETENVLTLVNQLYNDHLYLALNELATNA